MPAHWPKKWKRLLRCKKNKKKIPCRKNDTLWKKGTKSECFSQRTIVRTIYRPYYSIDIKRLMGWLVGACGPMNLYTITVIHELVIRCHKVLVKLSLSLALMDSWINATVTSRASATVRCFPIWQTVRELIMWHMPSSRHTSLVYRMKASVCPYSMFNTAISPIRRELGLPGDL